METEPKEDTAGLEVEEWIHDIILEEYGFGLLDATLQLIWNIFTGERVRPALFAVSNDLAENVFAWDMLFSAFFGVVIAILAVIDPTFDPRLQFAIGVAMCGASVIFARCFVAFAGEDPRAVTSCVVVVFAVVVLATLLLAAWAVGLFHGGFYHFLIGNVLVFVDLVHVTALSLVWWNRQKLEHLHWHLIARQTVDCAIDASAAAHAGNDR